MQSLRLLKEEGMGGTRLDIEKYVSDEMDKYKGTAFPVKAGLLTRMTVRKADCRDLHPNPADEFSMKEVGPSHRIIAEYEQEFLTNMKNSPYYYKGEPVIVEKMYPEGYMIVNGHHRWAAAMRIGQKTIPVKVVNLTHEEDVREMLQRSGSRKRVSMDLDEVVLCSREDDLSEKALPDQDSQVIKEPLRLGIPALFRYFRMKGYDLWVYTARYVSFDDIQKYLNSYHAEVDGVITGSGGKTGVSQEERKRIEKLVRDRYLETVHIDHNMVMRISSRTKSFDEYKLTGSAAGWSREIMEIAEAFKEDE